MNISYFNFSHHNAENRWERSSFASKWWYAYAHDPRWAPPYYPIFRRELDPTRNPHLARMSPRYIHSTALPRAAQPRRSQGSFLVDDSMVTGFQNEQMVAISLILSDPRRNDRTAYLALFRCTNDLESLERHLDFLAIQLSEQGVRRLLGPMGLSPNLCTGLLENCWDQIPPLYTPYNPPYLPEIFEQVLTPVGGSRLYHLEIPAELPPPPPSDARIVPFESIRLAGDLLSLFVQTQPTWERIPPIDPQESAFLVRWISAWPLTGCLAEVEGRPVGFMLLQPDLSPRLRLARGGRSLIRRAWLNLAVRKPTDQGRLIFGGVLPDWRGQGIGGLLLHQAIHMAHSQGWKQLVIGPVPDTDKETGSFLERRGARPMQKYRLYQWELA